MTNQQKALVEKYLTAIDKSTETAVMYDDLVEVVDAEYVKALIWDLIREYERTNSYPKVDFWGQEI